jgi:hypothetical protein
MYDLAEIREEEREKKAVESGLSSIQDTLWVISQQLKDLVPEKQNGSVEVSNLDEVQAGFHNELLKVVKQLVTLTAEVKNLKQKSLEVSNLKDIPIQKEVSVSNLKEIKIPETVTVSNLDEIKQAIASLASEIRSIPEPIVSVPPQEAPIISVNPTPVNVVERTVDLEPLMRQLDLNLNKLRTNDAQRPLAVRLSDGQGWIKQVTEGVKQGMSQVFTSFPGIMGLRAAGGTPIDPATSSDVTGGKLVPQNFDTIELSPADQPTSVVYKLNGVTVATLTITYSGTDISSVVRA